MENKRTYITKSGFMKGNQCELAFYNWWNKLEEVYTDDAQGRMEQGTEVGKLAQQLAPGGIDLNTIDLPPWELALKTKALLESGNPIYEATFITDSIPKLLCKVDILVPDTNGWQIWEVKATNSVKEEHIKDLAFQKVVLELCGVAISKIALVHLNNEYVRKGKLNIKKLFKIVDITTEVKSAAVGLDNPIKMMYLTGTLTQAPLKNIGAHCNSPYPCGYQSNCWKDFPDKDNIYTIPRLGKKGDFYFNSGLYKLTDLDPDILSEKQKRIWISHINNELIHDKSAIQTFLSSSVYPQYFLDFETINPAVPLWDNTSPYQQIPFQYSIHVIRSANTEPEHFEFLDDALGADPRPLLCKGLISDLGNSGTIWTFNQSFESGRIVELAALYPEYKSALNKILNRLNDLITPFRNHWYYDPKMQGSSSIKMVLPVLVPELNYETLDIGDGSAAMDVFLRLIKGDEELIIKKEQIMFHLREYCKMDTWAMVKIREKLLNNN